MVHRRTPALGEAIEKRQLPDTPGKSPKFLRPPRALMTSLSCVGPEGVKESDSGRLFCHPPGKYWVLEEKEQVLQQPRVCLSRGMLKTSLGKKHVIRKERLTQAQPQVHFRITNCYPLTSLDLCRGHSSLPTPVLGKSQH